ncbi:M23 family metallopeptidase [Arthrobacter sp. ISL-85]|uniref:M23 family metallopeptidase n=1 Tax=Arthrobacter sp. ISL-85 TaxID=2819115 RepID=UPI001BECB371|nr:M23 family metallopeptidase [Arthrobacter sp. ISL-85]MBT2565720.1 M23 family metallopeptidase [Arthrobacter sp. ISL-85]
MKPPVLLAALLLLPASVASPGPSFQYSAAGAGQPYPARSTVPRQEWTTAASGVGARPSWQWPLAPRPPVLRGFDPPPKPWLSGHRGVDLDFAGGTQVVSPASGTVSFVGVVVDRPVITIDHGGGLRSSFEPVESTLKVGAAVAGGGVIGTVLPGHCPAAQCLHWGVREGENYVNPLQFVLDLRPSILLPLSGPP